MGGVRDFPLPRSEFENGDARRSPTDLTIKFDRARVLVVGRNEYHLDIKGGRLATKCFDQPSPEAAPLLMAGNREVVQKDLGTLIRRHRERVGCQPSVAHHAR